MTFQKTFTALFATALSLTPTAALAGESMPMPPIYAEYAANLLQVSESVHAAALPLAADLLAVSMEQSLAISGGIIVLALLSLWLFRGRIAEFSK